MDYKKETIDQYIKTARDIVDMFNPEIRVLPLLNKLPEDMRNEFMDEYSSMVDEWQGYKKQIEKNIEEIKEYNE